MSNQIFEQSIKEYKKENFSLLEEYISSISKVDSYQWYYLLDLMQEQKVMNMPSGDFYITGTLTIFLEGLKKANKKDGILSFGKKVSMNFLAEEHDKFSEFLDLYVKKTMDECSYTLSYVFLGLNTGRTDKLWESFFNNFLDSLELDNFQDNEILNITKNINKVFDMDKSQHIKIMKAIEFESYPSENVLEEFLNYVNNFEKVILPRFDINNLGKNEDHEIKCKQFANILQKVNLENELIASKANENTLRIKNKI